MNDKVGKDVMSSFSVDKENRSVIKNLMIPIYRMNTATIFSLCHHLLQQEGSVYDGNTHLTCNKSSKYFVIVCGLNKWSCQILTFT